MPFAESKFALQCHPASPDAVVSAVGVTLRPDGGGIGIDYSLDGGLDALRVPGVGEQLPPERLWAHTCFELFVAGEGRAYREFNFSPSGQWMRFDFADYRQRIPSPASPAPSIATSRKAGRLDLAVRLPVELLPAGAMRIGLATVVEHADGSHRYWALRHPAAEPDFHHRDGFAIALKTVTP